LLPKFVNTNPRIEKDASSFRFFSLFEGHSKGQSFLHLRASSIGSGDTFRQSPLWAIFKVNFISSLSPPKATGIFQALGRFSDSIKGTRSVKRMNKGFMSPLSWRREKKGC
jgi:hypothetical protein